MDFRRRRRGESVYSYWDECKNWNKEGRFDALTAERIARNARETEIVCVHAEGDSGPVCGTEGAVVSVIDAIHKVTCARCLDRLRITPEDVDDV